MGYHTARKKSLQKYDFILMKEAENFEILKIILRRQLSSEFSIL
jgi:hypothetical protein